ncbi:MAG: hypothetical protein KDA89_21590 [Planctomycetaceae bacterium]|nr:hypothetical protein [Planctomycetaceae bacterium]
MSIYSPQRRFLLTIATTAVLLGIYVLFRVMTSPFLDVERRKQQFVRSPQQDVVPPEFRTEAAKWFPEDPWVSASGKHFRDSGRYVYFRDFDLDEQKRAIVFRPIAVLWKTDPDRPPVTMVAESAELQHSHALSLQDAELGRITGGLLTGNVRIHGPDGLSITGRTFQISEDSMMLWTSQPVSFTWQGHTGSASSGVEIHLNGDPVEGLTEVTNVREVNLLGRVVCNVDMPATRVGDEAVRMKVSAARGFSFDVLTRTATFQGESAQSNRRSGPAALKAADEVWVKRLNDDGTEDQLVCPELKFQFRERVDPDTGQSEPDSLQLSHITAWGHRVVFHSSRYDVVLIGNDLQYSVDAARIDIRHTHLTPDGQPNPVELRQGENRLLVPHVRIIHSREGHGVQRIECNGPGSIAGSPPPETEAADDAESAVSASQTVVATDAPPQFTASWSQSLVMQVAADQVSRLISLRGTAVVSQVDRGFRLAARTIAMKLAGTGDSPHHDSADSGPAENTIADGHRAASATPEFLPDDFTQLRPEILTAVGSVVLTSPDGTGRLREKLTVRFEDMVPVVGEDVSEGTRNPFRTAGLSSAADETTDEDGSDQSPQVSFVSDTLDAIIRVSNDPDNRQMQFHNVWLNGDVEIVRASEDPEKAFSAHGNQLYAGSGLSDQHDIHLFGDPARVTRRGGTLEGPRIDLTEVSGTAEVVGSGRIRFVTDKGFDGKPLPRPMPLDIFWTDHMHVQNREAHFVGNIRAVMSDDQTQRLEIRCAGLTVHLDRDISVGPQKDDGEVTAVTYSAAGEISAGPIERIECHNRVDVTIEQFTNKDVSARHTAEFADLSVNLKTGDFHAVGPGFLKSVTPDRNGQLQGAAPPAVRANTPAQTRDTAFVHMTVSFIGELHGNLHRQDAELSHHVQAVVVPVRRVDEEVDLSRVSTTQLPETAGMLSAERLTINAIPGPSEDSRSFAIVARTNARLESQTISGNADVITYDHAKEQFILRAEGNGFANVNHRSAPDGQFNRLVGKRFEYYRRTNELNADQIRSLDVLPDSLRRHRELRMQSTPM